MISSESNAPTNGKAPSGSGGLPSTEAQDYWACPLYPLTLANSTIRATAAVIPSQAGPPDVQFVVQGDLLANAMHQATLLVAGVRRVLMEAPLKKKGK
jgi:hypothetical protein